MTPLFDSLLKGERMDRTGCMGRVNLILIIIAGFWAVVTQTLWPILLPIGGILLWIVSEVYDPKKEEEERPNWSNP